MLPSTKNLSRINSKATPGKLRRLLESYCDGAFYEPHQHYGREVEAVMEQANKLIGGFGVESLRGGEYHSGFWQDCAALYVNLGDTYNTTLLYEIARDRFVVISLGDFIERNEHSNL